MSFFKSRQNEHSLICEFLFRYSPDGYLVLDGERIVDCNDAAQKMLGLTKEKILGLHPAVLSPEFQPDGRRSSEKGAEMDAIAKKQGFHRFEWMHQRLDGTPMPMLVTSLKAEIGGRALVIGFWQDISELTSYRQTVKEANERATIKRVEQEQVFDTLSAALGQLTVGDLDCIIRDDLPAEYKALQTNFNKTVDQLSSVIGEVDRNAATLNSSSGEISSAMNELAKRTELQANSIEAAASAVDHIKSIIEHSASGAEKIGNQIDRTRSVAELCAKVVDDTVEAMNKIKDTSDQVNTILSVIDEIAFQTNLLALNAGVEAARAGETGKGFAVVAQEVRELAHRSATAAKEIKSLITASGNQVKNGVELVGETGRALKDIATEITQTTSQVKTLISSAKEQEISIQDIRQSVAAIDKSTQLNAAMAEETAAAVGDLARQASSLSHLTQRFSSKSGRSETRKRA